MSQWCLLGEMSLWGKCLFGGSDFWGKCLLGEMSSGAQSLSVELNLSQFSCISSAVFEYWPDPSWSCQLTAPSLSWPSRWWSCQLVSWTSGSWALSSFCCLSVARNLSYSSRSSSAGQKLHIAFGSNTADEWLLVLPDSLHSVAISVAVCRWISWVYGTYLSSSQGRAVSKNFLYKTIKLSDQAVLGSVELNWSNLTTEDMLKMSAMKVV